MRMNADQIIESISYLAKARVCQKKENGRITYEFSATHRIALVFAPCAAIWHWDGTSSTLCVECIADDAERRSPNYHALWLEILFLALHPAQPNPVPLAVDA